MKVSLVTTVLDGADSIGEFLDSVAAQTRPPDEIVVCDGGSTDGTLDVLRNVRGISLIEERGANIARGRNVAIAAATHDVIAVSDADCVLEPDWLERLVRPIEAGADVSMGFYRPIVDGFFQACMAAINLPDADEIDEGSFMPSSRSIAFTREAIEAAGGYPEWLDIGEDMYVNHRWRELELDLRLARDAIARWRLRPTLAETWTQYLRYARGDAIAGMHPERHALRFGVYSGTVYAWASRSRLLRLLTVAGGVAYIAQPLHRAWTRSTDPADRARSVVAVPLLLAFVDLAKMAGYASGLPRRREREPRAG